MKKKTKTPKKTSWKFDIGQITYDIYGDLRPYRPVLLDNKEIYRIDKTKVYGNIEKDQNKEVLEALKKETGLDFTKDEIQRALTIGILEKEK